MIDHITESALEGYLLGTALDADVDAIERHVTTCEACAKRIRRELAFEAQLGEVGRNARFCPGCSRLLEAERCDDCGAAAIAGPYKIERVLVRSTHGRLYVARGVGDEHDGRKVALKELAFVQTPSFEALAAFERETKFLRALQHPGIPKFHASFAHGTGIHTRFYLAQDLVEGESLLARLATHWFDEREIIGIAARVLEILVYLQNLSPMIFHRDVKPANLIALPNGGISLVDFGAARDVSETMGNTSIGTFGYMPTEQMGGIVDATTDTYALGMSLRHLLTRREPWKLLGEGPSGVNVSPALRRYLDKLTAQRPEDRFPTARAALDALNLVRTKPASRVDKRSLVIATTALALAGAGIGAAVALRGEDDQQERGREAIARMEAFAQQMCNCNDKACADGVNQAMTSWGREMARKADRDDKPAPELAKQSGEIMARYTECMTRTMMAARSEPKTTQSLSRVYPNSSDPIELAPNHDLLAPAERPGERRRPTCRLEDRLPSGRCPDDAMTPPPRPDAACKAEERLPSGRCPGDPQPARPPIVRKPPSFGACPLEHRKPDGTCVDHGTLVVNSKPPARVSIDGVDTQLTTPAKFVLRVGNHKIQFAIDDRKYTFAVTIKEGETTRVVKDFSEATP